MNNRLRQALLGFILLNQVAWAQTNQQVSLATLGQITQQMQRGIYERIINLGYLPSPPKFTRGFTPQAHNEFTFVYLRFSDFEPTSDQRAYIGKLFMSERYLESHYNKRYTHHKVYENDKDGFFMMCKLYFDERTLEYRLNVYPDYVLNICRGDMHANKQRCTSTEQHWKSLKYVAQLPDRYFDDFSQRDNTDSTKAFLTTTDSQLNIRHMEVSGAASIHPDSVRYKPSPTARNLLRTINLSKQIKAFKVGFLEDEMTSIGKTLTLKWTKYPLSEDLIEGAEYSYNFIATDSMNDTELAQRGQHGFFVSRNPLYRSLITSNEPNDQFVHGIDLSKDLILAYRKGNTYQRTQKLLKPTDPSPNTIAQQDSNLKYVQQKTDSAKAAVVPLNIDDRILISSNTSRSSFWIYGGRDVATERIPGEGSKLKLQEPQYLRDTLPILADSIKRIWLKGKISFRKNDCLIEPGDEKTGWRVDAIHFVKDPFSTSRYLWIRVSAIESTIPNRRIMGINLSRKLNE
ncbi:hypothetical protein [Larkinella rosea]|uniref:Uncharacterized protein n=1 Tax=Larkinella rosea TaxID=2025312 RepID=A0A3P1BTQ2_9BACT|nr:hypothetical protein [Larkinella rosea]RRB04437.1 hypothetical protein EHT25_13135 [Larkinella rosea]